MTVLARNWWAIVLRGVLSVLFGLVALFVPQIALSALITLYGAYALVDGAFNIAAGLTGARSVGGSRGWLIFEGVVSIVVGVLVFVYPGVTALVLLSIIAFWAILTGVLEVIAAIRLRQEITGEFWLGLAGVLSILFGVFSFVNPQAGALSVITIIGVYALLFGVLLVLLGLRLRGWTKQHNLGAADVL